MSGQTHLKSLNDWRLEIIVHSSDFLNEVKKIVSRINCFAPKSDSRYKILPIVIGAEFHSKGHFFRFNRTKYFKCVCPILNGETPISKIQITL